MQQKVETRSMTSQDKCVCVGGAGGVIWIG